MDEGQIMADKILYFNPYAGILEHLKIERDLQRVIKNSDMHLDIVRCDGIYSSYCNVMSAMSLTPNSDQKSRNDVCANCKSLDKFSRNIKSSTYLHLDRFLTPEIETEVDIIMLEIHIDNWKEFVFQGEFFGRIAAYEFLLRYKLSNSTIPAHLWLELRNDIADCLKTYFIAVNILKKSNYKLVGVYNYLYGPNRAFIVAAEQLGKKTFSVQGHGFIYNMHSRYMVYGTDGGFWHLNSSKEWQIAKNKPMSVLEILRVLRHLRSLFAAKSVWTYSSPAGNFNAKIMRSKLEIPADTNIALLTTSSADEQFAFNFVGLVSQESHKHKPVFQDNLDWIENTISIFRQLPSKVLVIRVHPREFANKREGVNSSSGFQILNKIRSLDLPKNVILNEPSDELSLYDLAQITELLINSTSTVGLEFTAMGIPSITISPASLVAYPHEFSKSIYSKDDYVDSIVNDTPNRNLANITLAFRWINFRHALCNVKIPLYLQFSDRFYFGVYRRLVLQFPLFNNVSDKFVKLLNGIFNSVDNRKFVFYTFHFDSFPAAKKMLPKFIERFVMILVIKRRKHLPKNY